MNNTNLLSASEIGSLWQTYQEKTLVMRFLEYFMKHSEGEQSRNILGGLWQELNFFVQEMEDVFMEQGMVKPIGFTSEDVHLDAPRLFDNNFDIMFIRMLKEVSMGLYALNMNMSYNKRVMHIYEGLTTITQKIYKLSTYYLLEKGLLSLPPKVTLPNKNTYIEDKSYMDGFKIIGNKRPLNDMEMGILYHNLLSNNIGLQLITGFAQCAQNKEARHYFQKGIKLAKKQIKTMEELLREGDISYSTSSVGTVTNSTTAPFSDKLMMHCIYILNGFGLVGAGTGAFFSLRNDISVKTITLAKDVYFFAQEGVKIKISNGWFEEPPQTEDRNQILKGKN